MSVAFRLAIAAVSGAALSFSFTGLYLGIFSWVCVAVLLIAVFGAQPRISFLCGFLHALCFVLASVPWIATVLTVHGGLSPVGGWALLLLIACAWGALTGGFAWSVNRIARRSIGIACTGAPFLWVAFEFLRAHLPEIGFPWNLLGYSASANLALIQITPVTGIYGLSFLVASFNALIAWAGAEQKRQTGRRATIVTAVAACGVVIMLVGGKLVPIPEAHHYARAVQLNFPEVQSYGADWFRANASAMEEIEKLSLLPGTYKADLLVWPEAPAPFSFQDQHFAKIASDLAIRFQHPFIAGAIEWRNPGDGLAHERLAPYNSALLIDPQGQNTFTYDKIHLVPFGEYEPFPLIHRVVTSVSDEVGGFRKGRPSYAVARLNSEYSVGVFICYEAIFPDEVRRFAENGASLLVNISNDGWFGRSAAAEQHLRMARVRAAENRRWLVRATNNGFTASVDPFGRMLIPLPPDVRAGADLPYDFRTDTTIYTRFGNWFAWLCVLVSGILMAITFRKRA